MDFIKTRLLGAAFLVGSTVSVVAACSFEPGVPQDFSGQETAHDTLSQRQQASCTTPELIDLNVWKTNLSGPNRFAHFGSEHASAVNKPRRIIVTGDGNEAWLSPSEMGACITSAAPPTNLIPKSEERDACLRGAFLKKRTNRILPADQLDAGTSQVDAVVFELSQGFGMFAHPSAVAVTVNGQLAVTSQKDWDLFEDVDDVPAAAGDRFQAGTSGDVFVKYALNSIPYHTPPKTCVGTWVCPVAQATNVIARFDPLFELIRKVRQSAPSVEVFAGFRVNDTHDASDDEEFEKGISPFKWSVLSGQLDSSLLFDGTDMFDLIAPHPVLGRWSSVDYGALMVRSITSGVADEVMKAYGRRILHTWDASDGGPPTPHWYEGIDGIQLNFARHFAYFRGTSVSGDAASPCELAKMTDMMRRIRDAANKAAVARARPMLISVIVPDDLDYAHDIGLDLRTWYQERLVDLVVGGDYMQLRSWAESVADLPVVDPTNPAAGPVKFYAGFSNTRLVGDKDKGWVSLRATPQAFRGRALEAHSENVDGISVCNAEYNGIFKPLWTQLGSKYTASVDELLAFGSYTGADEAVGNIRPYVSYIGPDGPRPFAAPDYALVLPPQQTKRWHFRTGRGKTPVRGRIHVVFSGKRSMRAQLVDAANNRIDLGHGSATTAVAVPAELDYEAGSYMHSFEISEPAEVALLDLPTLKVEITSTSTASTEIWDIILQFAPCADVNVSPCPADKLPTLTAIDSFDGYDFR